MALPARIGARAAEEYETLALTSVPAPARACAVANEWSLKACKSSDSVRKQACKQRLAWFL